MYFGELGYAMEHASARLASTLVGTAAKLLIWAATWGMGKIAQEIMKWRKVEGFLKTHGDNPETREALVKTKGNVEEAERLLAQKRALREAEARQQAAEAERLRKIEDEAAAKRVKDQEDAARRQKDQEDAARQKLQEEVVRQQKRKPLGAKSIVLDENMVIARDKYLKGDKLQAGEQKMMDYLNANPDAELTVSEELYNKVLGKKDTTGLNIMIPTSAAGSPEYNAVIKFLENNTVGQSKGAEDRRLIADALFAKTEPGVTPTIIVHDPGIYNKMFMIGKKDPKALIRLGKSLPEALPEGFNVTIPVNDKTSRTIKVVPLKRK